MKICECLEKVEYETDKFNRFKIIDRLLYTVDPWTGKWSLSYDEYNEIMLWDFKQCEKPFKKLEKIRGFVTC